MSDGGTELERVTSERDQYREALVDANRQLDALRAQVTATGAAVVQLAHSALRAMDVRDL